MGRPGTAEPASARTLLGSARLTPVLVVLCLLLAAGAGVRWWPGRGEHPSAAPVASVPAREAGLRAAGALTGRVLSYDWRTLEEDTRRSEAVLAPGLRSQYAAAMARVRARTIAGRVGLTARVTDAAVVSATDARVVALVFVDQVTTARGTSGRRLDQKRVLVSLTRHDGHWRVSGMDTF